MTEEDDGVVFGIVCKLCGMTLPPCPGNDFLNSESVASMTPVEFAKHLSSGLSQEEADRALVLRCLANCPHIRPGSAWSDAHFVAGVWKLSDEPSEKKKKL